MTDEDICGAETAGTDEPCQNPAGENGRCWIPTHQPGAVDDVENPNGRPSALNQETKEAIYAAVGSGLKVAHVAAAAGVSAQTLRRWTCCIDDLGEAVPDDDPCNFCEGYAQAHAEGAREVLEECRPEFRASASFGYNKTEGRELTGEGGGPVAVEFNETVHETDWEPPTADSESEPE
jgi:transposase-like protein